MHALVLLVFEKTPLLMPIEEMVQQVSLPFANMKKSSFPFTPEWEIFGILTTEGFRVTASTQMMAVFLLAWE